MLIKLKVMVEKDIDITNVDEVRATADQEWTIGGAPSDPWAPSLCVRVKKEIEVHRS